MSDEEKVIRFYAKLCIDADKTQIIDAIPGVIESFPLFPENEDEELRRIWVVDVEPKLATGILIALSDHQDVEYVELPAMKKSV